MNFEAHSKDGCEIINNSCVFSFFRRIFRRRLNYCTCVQRRFFGRRRCTKRPRRTKNNNTIIGRIWPSCVSNGDGEKRWQIARNRLVIYHCVYVYVWVCVFFFSCYLCVCVCSRPSYVSCSSAHPAKSFLLTRPSGDRA